MTIKEYIKDYTAGNRIVLTNVLSEVKELIIEVIKLNKAGIEEEWGDVFHFIQLWFYWRFGINGRIWRISQKSVDKFISRKRVWNKIYVKAGLKENISGYAGNYKKLEKVIRHLAQFGVDKQNAERVYYQIVKV